MTEIQGTPRLSLRPDAFSHGGGLVDDIDVTIVGAKWSLFDYQGKAAKETMALRLDLEDDEKNKYEQYYSAADPKYFEPIKGGRELKATSDRAALSDGSNFYIFIVSLHKALQAAGYDLDTVIPDSTDVSWMEGMSVHVLREKQPERKGIAKQADDSGRDKTVLCISKVYSLAGEKKKGGKSTAAAGGKTNGAAAAAADDETTAAATEAVLTLLGEQETVPKAKLSGLLFASMKKSGLNQQQINRAMVLAIKDDFLKSGPWTFDGTTLSMG